jgi:hypothetical protein
VVVVTPECLFPVSKAKLPPPYLALFLILLGKKAGLRAILPEDTITPNAPIHLNVVQQDGSGYDAATGIYTAPYAGWYTVDFQLFPKEVTHGYFNVDLYLNGGNPIARARYMNDENW